MTGDFRCVPLRYHNRTQPNDQMQMIPYHRLRQKIDAHVAEPTRQAAAQPLLALSAIKQPRAADPTRH